MKKTFAINATIFSIFAILGLLSFANFNKVNSRSPSSDSEVSIKKLVEAVKKDPFTQAQLQKVFDSQNISCDLTPADVEVSLLPATSSSGGETYKIFAACKKNKSGQNLSLEVAGNYKKINGAIAIQPTDFNLTKSH